MCLPVKSVQIIILPGASRSNALDKGLVFRRETTVAHDSLPILSLPERNERLQDEEGGENSMSRFY